MPKVSIIIPAYKAAEYLPDTLASIWAQTYTDFEVILVNDGSPDDTDVVAAAQTDPRFHYHKKENTGVSNTRNEGLKHAKGQYITFFDADDLMEPGFLQACVNQLDASDAKAVYVAFTPFWHGSNRAEDVTRFEAGNEIFKLLTFTGNAGHPPSTVLIRRDVLDKVGGFDPKLSTSADWDMWVRIGMQGNFAYLDQPLVRYRLHAQQMHRNVNLMRDDMLYAFRKAKQLGAFKGRASYSRCLAKLYLVLAGSYYHDARKPLKAAKYTLKSLFTHPGALLGKFFTFSL